MPDLRAALGLAALGCEAEKLDVAKEFFEIALKSSPKDANEWLRYWGVELFTAEKFADGVKLRDLVNSHDTSHTSQTADKASDGAGAVSALDRGVAERADEPDLGLACKHHVVKPNVRFIG